jgi:hypothetical protein
MRVLELDLLLFSTVVPMLIWARFWQPPHVYQGLCLSASTFWAQFSVGISWNLPKLAPIAAIFGRSARGPKLHGAFVGFLVLSCVWTLLYSPFWNIPSGVDPFYGEYRAYVQIALLIITALASASFARAHSTAEQVFVFWVVLTTTVVVHSLFSFYQFLAWELGLPLIGISRAHNQTLDLGVADIAAFVVDSGEAVIRPSGLAGEPKTAAVLYGMYAASSLFAGLPRSDNRAVQLIGPVATVFSIISFILAFSTSAIVGFLTALLLCTIYFRNTVRLRRTLLVITGLGMTVLLMKLAGQTGGVGLGELITQRTLDRFDADFLDPPVEAALAELATNPIVLFLGTGQGGSSFVVMNYWGDAYRFAYSPNIGLILLLVEAGLIGVLLLVIPYFRLARQISLRLNPSSYLHDWAVRFMFALSLASFAICLAGSGIGLGPMIAFGGLLVARKLSLVSVK